MQVREGGRKVRIRKGMIEVKMQGGGEGLEAVIAGIENGGRGLEPRNAGSF